MEVCIFFFIFYHAYENHLKNIFQDQLKLSAWQEAMNNLLTICGINGVLYQSSTNFSKQTKPFKVLNFKTYNASQKN